MSAVYFCIASYDQNNFSRGIQVVQRAIKDGYEQALTRFRAKEMNLTYTGYAPNCYNLMAYGDEKNVQEFVSSVSEKFDVLLCASYQVNNVSEIEFDDENFEEEFEQLFQFIGEKFGPIQTTTDNFYSLDI